MDNSYEENHKRKVASLSISIIRGSFHFLNTVSLNTSITTLHASKRCKSAAFSSTIRSTEVKKLIFYFLY